MTTLAHVRTAVKRLAEVAKQETGDGSEQWMVAENVFVSVADDRRAVRLRLPAADAETVLVDIPGSSLSTRDGSVIGVEIPLAAMNGMQANAVIGRAWAHCAPPRLTQAVNEASAGESDLPAAIGRPARRALHTAGIASLAELATCTRPEIAALHGIGPRAMDLLTQALAARGLDWHDHG